ncbi:hypothetical protein HMN09_00789100 [Mycena chlorophos]|uniref:F-box domain-containing protein n=1 Tax=Mycena chlorophos TaxID=658473 RepID=A0A8H6W4H0_MYCCL|nr:hypothetical protein HMN09_00789100 [Mycena chlorophos]
MHRCLQIAEVLDNIFSLLPHPSDPTLARLARTCRAFSDPALDILWWRQETLTNLSRCLLAATDSNTAVRIFPLILWTVADWKRTFKYRRRVRDFCLVTALNLGERFATEAFLQAVQKALPLAELPFPNLRHLDWIASGYGSVDEWFCYLRLLSSPALVSLTLRQYDLKTASDVERIFTIETVPWGLLRRLSISTMEANVDPMLPFAFSAISARLEHIETLHLPLVDAAGLGHLSFLPNLRSLTLDSVPTGTLLSGVDFSGGNRFPALKELVFEDANPDTAAEFLSTKDTTWEIESLTLEASESEPRERVASLYTTIAAHCSRSHLRALCLSSQDTLPDPPASTLSAHALTLAATQTLFCFPNLTTVVLLHGAGFLLQDDDVPKLASAWPNIVNLHLGTASASQVRPTATLKSWTTLLERCPLLRRLTFAVDATQVPVLPARVRPAELRNLIYLDVGFSPIDDAEEVARFLSASFSGSSKLAERISTLSEWRWDGEDDAHRDEEDEERDYFERWQQVNDLIATYGAIREEERQWAASGQL